LNLEYFIAKRLIKKDYKSSISLLKIAISAIAIGMIMMIVFWLESVCNKNQRKCLQWHIIISNYDNNQSEALVPISKNRTFILSLMVEGSVIFRLSPKQELN
jgi:hypothetical protein